MITTPERVTLHHGPQSIIPTVNEFLCVLTHRFVSIIIWVLEAIPVYKLAIKMNRKNAWLAWVPIFGSKFRLWVLSDIAGDKPFTVFNGKFTVKSRSNSFWIYIAINYLGGAVVSAVVGVFSAIIPLFGSLSAVLMLVPAVPCALMEYVSFCIN